VELEMREREEGPKEGVLGSRKEGERDWSNSRGGGREGGQREGRDAIIDEEVVTLA
jgi:hypothetical protein